MVDGTSITDTALARKLEAAVKRDVAIKVRLAYDVKLADRFDVVHALVNKAGVTNIEVSTSIVTQVPDKAPPPADNTPTIVLTVDNKGGLMLGARRVPDAELDAELATVAKRTKKIALAADKATTYATIVKLMDRCKAAGLTDIMFIGN